MKEHEKYFGSDGYIHYDDCANCSMDIHMLNLSNCVLSIYTVYCMLVTA